MCQFCREIGFQADADIAAVHQASFDLARPAEIKPGNVVVARTGVQNVDALFAGSKFDITALTFAFPTSVADYGANYGDMAALQTNFGTFSEVQRVGTRAVLNLIDSVAGLTFTETTNAADATLRLALSDQPATAYAYLPGSGNASGDSFYRKTDGTYDNPVRGNYAWVTLLHEIGHNLGLKHGHETGNFGALTADRDSMEFSVMTYRSFIGGDAAGGYTNQAFSFAQTLMMYDIAALQTLYGADYGTNSGDSVYRWSASTGEMSINGVGQGAPGENRIFLTVWDGGGNDTYDFSNYTTALAISLQPGGWSKLSDAQIAELGPGQLARANVFNALTFQGNNASLIENAIGGSGNDVLIGNVANNRLTGGAGNDNLDGLEGVDTMVLSVAQADVGLFRFTNGLGASVSATLGRDRFVNIETVEFTDRSVAVASIDVRSILEYTASYGDLITAFGKNGTTAFDHFINNGAGRSITFSSFEYSASYSDLRVAFGIDRDAAASHYIDAGRGEGRFAWFDGLRYAAGYTDLLAAFGSDGEAATRHFIQSGAGEGRKVLFDAQQYLDNYADLRAAFGTNTEQALARVWFTGLEYVASHADLMAAIGGDSARGLQHYLTSGRTEGRTASFDGLAYIASHRDLIAAFRADDDLGARHYIENGRNEGRTVQFDATSYLQRHADLQAVFGQDLGLATKHYIEFGFAEGRTA